MKNAFVVPQPLNSDLTYYWTMWGTIATAAGTLALAIFAILAWRAALSTIRAQRNSDQLAALSEYVKALHALSGWEPFRLIYGFPTEYSFQNHQEQLREYESRLANLSREVESTGMIWRAHHKSMGGALAKFAEAEHFLTDSQQWWRATPQNDKQTRSEQHRLWSEFGKSVCREATRWQVQEHNREKTADTVSFKIERFLRESPLRPSEWDSYIDS